MKPIKTVVFMMGATVLAKLLALFRDMLQSNYYGIGSDANALTMASNISHTFFDMLLSAAILGCFIPVYNSFKQDDTQNADRFACIFFNTILLATGVLALLGIVFAEPLVSFFGANLDEATRILTVKLLRIMFPMVIFMGTTFTLVGVMQSKGRYMIPALISVISNAVVVIYLIFSNNNIYGLAVMYLISWIVQLITLVVPLVHSGFKLRPILDFKSPELRRTLRMAPPIMIGSWLMSFTSLSGVTFSSFVGNVTVFDYSMKTYTLIVGILTHSICNYIFPILSKLSAHGDEEEFNDMVRTGLTASFAIMIPFMCMVYVLSGEGISVMFMRGEFTSEAAYLTASTLRLMTFAMPAFAVIEILNRVFYSKNLPKIPMIATLCGIGVNVISAALLIQLDGVGVGAVSTAAALAQLVTAGVLLIFLYRRIKGVINKKLIFNALKVLTAGIVSFIVMLLLYRLIGNNPYNSGELRNIIVMLIIFAAGAVIYVGGLFVTRFKIKHRG